MPEHPPSKRFYGAITVSERGQIVIPADARRDFNIQVGDKLLVLGDIEQGLALVKASALLDKNPDFFQLLLGSPSPGSSTESLHPSEDE